MSPIEESFRAELNSDQLLKLMFDYVAKISAEAELTKLLMLMADMGRELIVADRCTLWLLDEVTDELWTKVAHGMPEVRIPANAGIVGHAISDGMPIIINNPYEDSRFNQSIDKQTGYTTKNIIAIPIRNSDDKIMGAYQAINKLTEAQVFAQKDVDHLVLAAAYSAKALESAALYKEIEDTQKEIIFTMAEVGESRSKETGNHVKRVAEYSYILAKGYGLSDSDADLLKMASPMHDIGKIGISDAILKKPGKLTEEEFEVMKTHAELGYDMLKNSHRHILKAAATVANEHHEKWNGRGYPIGLKGEEIHIFGRITAMADVFDALASDRCYKKAWPLEKIYGLFREERGEHFDPKLVDIFFEHLDKVVYIHETYQDKFEEE
jgi:response regulator RpfG family c-di-GMP phosphodiesterase